ncbi:MAG: MFS transporter [Prolixibacteraceae bacterium]|jgi:MFS family permease|nr:MFS transporter [Prolixibacteraceae bacterium]
MTKEQYKKIYPWVVVALLWMVAMLNYMDRQMLSTMKVAMMGDIHELEKAENFGRLMAIFLWIYALMSPMAGLIADRVNRKWLIVGSLAVWSGVTMAMGYSTTFNQLYALRAMMGISEALYIPAGLSLIADYHKGPTRSLAVGIHLSGLYLGQALGGFGATVAHSYSWQQAFHLFGLIGICYSLVLVFFLKDIRIQIPASKKSTFSDGFKSVVNSLGMIFGNMSFWVVLFFFTAPSFPGWAVKSWIPTLFSQTLGIDMSIAGPMATITIAGSSLFSVVLGGYMADRWMRVNVKGRIYTGVIGLGLMVPALLFLGYGTGYVGILGGAILFGLGFGMFDTNCMPILCQFVTARHRAAAYGLMNMAGISSGALITIILGKSTDAGSLGHDVALLAIPVVMAIILQLAVLKPKFADKTED